jgi:hypothetical protein
MTTGKPRQGYPPSLSPRRTLACVPFHRYYAHEHGDDARHSLGGVWEVAVVCGIEECELWATS